jgi:hypothetical protein
MSNIFQKAGMARNVITNFLKNDIAVLVSCNNNLGRATTQLLIDKAWKYLSYPLMEAKIFILSCNVEIKKYKPVAEPGGGQEGAQHPLRTFAPPLAKFLEDIFFSDTIMYKGGKAIFFGFQSRKIRKNP